MENIREMLIKTLMELNSVKLDKTRIIIWEYKFRLAKIKIENINNKIHKLLKEKRK